jgi:deoxyribose-phosphate aldolase
MNDDRALARRALPLLDLTELSDNCDDSMVRDLCRAATDPLGNVAAVCVWPEFVALAKALLVDADIGIATVVNFPYGEDPIERVLSETSAAVANGADEIDLVLPWRAFLAGDEPSAREMVAAVREAIGLTTLKVILESGMYTDHSAVTCASLLAIDSGADFLKTSTGKAAISATPEAVRTMMATIRNANRVVGIKPSGGIRSLSQARIYLDIVDSVMGSDWATPTTFRFGTSALHADILKTLVRFVPSH